jgi:hypothetical protein
MAAAPRQARSSSLVLREVTDAVASMPVPPIEQMVLGAAPSWPTATTAKNMLDVLAGAILKLKTTSPTAAPRYAYVAPKGVTGVGQATRLDGLRVCPTQGARVFQPVQWFDEQVAEWIPAIVLGDLAVDVTQEPSPTPQISFQVAGHGFYIRASAGDIERGTVTVEMPALHSSRLGVSLADLAMQHAFDQAAWQVWQPQAAAGARVPVLDAVEALLLASGLAPGTARLCFQYLTDFGVATIPTEAGGADALAECLYPMGEILASAAGLTGRAVRARAVVAQSARLLAALDWTSPQRPDVTAVFASPEGATLALAFELLASVLVDQTIAGAIGREIAGTAAIMGAERAAAILGCALATRARLGPPLPLPAAARAEDAPADLTQAVDLRATVAATHAPADDAAGLAARARAAPESPHLPTGPPPLTRGPPPLTRIPPGVLSGSGTQGAAAARSAGAGPSSGVMTVAPIWGAVPTILPPSTWATTGLQPSVVAEAADKTAYDLLVRQLADAREQLRLQAAELAAAQRLAASTVARPHTTGSASPAPITLRALGVPRAPSPLSFAGSPCWGAPSASGGHVYGSRASSPACSIAVSDAPSLAEPDVCGTRFFTLFPHSLAGCTFTQACAQLAGDGTSYTPVFEAIAHAAGEQPAGTWLGEGSQAFETERFYEDQCIRLDEYGRGTTKAAEFWRKMSADWSARPAADVPAARVRFLHWRQACTLMSGELTAAAAARPNGIPKKELPHLSYEDIPKVSDTAVDTAPVAISILEPLSDSGLILSLHSAGAAQSMQLVHGSVMPSVVCDAARTLGERPEIGTAVQTFLSSDGTVAEAGAPLTVPRTLPLARRALRHMLVAIAKDAVGLRRADASHFIVDPLGKSRTVISAIFELCDRIQQMRINRHWLEIAIILWGGHSPPEPAPCEQPQLGSWGCISSLHAVFTALPIFEEMWWLIWGRVIGCPAATVAFVEQTKGKPTGADFGLERGLAFMLAQSLTLEHAFATVDAFFTRLALAAAEWRTTPGAPPPDPAEMLTELKAGMPGLRLDAKMGTRSAASPAPPASSAASASTTGAFVGAGLALELSTLCTQRGHGPWALAAATTFAAGGMTAVAAVAKAGALSYTELKEHAPRREKKQKTPGKEGSLSKKAKSPVAPTAPPVAPLVAQPPPAPPPYPHYPPYGVTPPYGGYTPPGMMVPYQSPVPPGFPPGLAPRPPPQPPGNQPGHQPNPGAPARSQPSPGETGQDAMTRVTRDLDAYGPGSGTFGTLVDAVRVFDILARRRGAIGCGWRAAVRADHSACAATKNCSGCKTPYVAAVEAPLALEVAAFCTQALQARMCS